MDADHIFRKKRLRNARWRPPHLRSQTEPPPLIEPAIVADLYGVIFIGLTMCGYSLHLTLHSTVSPTPNIEGSIGATVHSCPNYPCSAQVGINIGRIEPAQPCAWNEMARVALHQVPHVNSHLPDYADADYNSMKRWSAWRCAWSSATGLTATFCQVYHADHYSSLCDS